MEETLNQTPTGEEQVVDDTGVELESDKVTDELDELDVEEIKNRYRELKKKNESAEEIAKRLKDEKSQSKRQEIEQQKTREAENQKQEFISTQIESIIESDMNISDEQVEEASKLGISKEQLKLMAYETKEMLNTIYSAVGGKDAYFDMVDTVRASATEQEQQAFKVALSNPLTQALALEALQARYAKLTGKTFEHDNRIIPKGVVADKSSSAYNNIQEYYADMAKMRKLPSSEQQTYYSKIQAKLNRSGNLV